MSPRPRTAGQVYFVCGQSPLAAEAFEAASARRPDLAWRRCTLLGEAEGIAFEAERHAPDVIISFLNGYVVKKDLLDAAGLGAFNVHPASPEYPGRDPWHFAYYDGSQRAGATLHRMTAKVDDGEILDVSECEFDASLPVGEYAELCRRLAFSLLMRNLDAMLDGTIAPSCPRAWRSEAKRSRSDFARMCEIDPAMSADEVARRLRSFHDPKHENLYTVIHGHKFFYRVPDRS